MHPQSDGWSAVLVQFGLEPPHAADAVAGTTRSAVQQPMIATSSPNVVFEFSMLCPARCCWFLPPVRLACPTPASRRLPWSSVRGWPRVETLHSANGRRRSREPYRSKICAASACPMRPSDRSVRGEFHARHATGGARSHSASTVHYVYVASTRCAQIGPSWNFGCEPSSASVLPSIQNGSCAEPGEAVRSRPPRRQPASRHGSPNTKSYSRGTKGARPAAG